MCTIELMRMPVLEYCMRSGQFDFATGQIMMILIYLWPSRMLEVSKSRGFLVCTRRSGGFHVHS